MFRAILELIIVVLVITALRSVLKILGTFFSSIRTVTQPGAEGSRPSSSPVTGELRKDPVCGTFISTATAHQKRINGEMYYFCSADCRDKFHV